MHVCGHLENQGQTQARVENSDFGPSNGLFCMFHLSQSNRNFPWIPRPCMTQLLKPHLGGRNTSREERKNGNKKGERRGGGVGLKSVACQVPWLLPRPPWACLILIANLEMR